MKKIKILSFVLVGLCLTGCTNGKKVECAYYEQSDDLKITNYYTLNYDKNGDILKTLELVMDLDFSDKNALNEFVGQADNDVCAFIKKDLSNDVNNNIKCKSKEVDNKISITLTYNYSKLSDSEKQKLFANLTYDELKKLYESNNFEQDMCSFDSDKKITPSLNNNGIFEAINSSQVDLAEDSANAILKSAEMAEAEYMLENLGEMIPANDSNGVEFICNGEKCLYIPNGKDSIVLDFKGVVPTSGKILLDKNGNATIKTPLIINGYKCKMSSNRVECHK